MKADELLRFVIAIGTFVLWIAWNVADALSQSIEGNAGLQGVMMVIAGWLFAGPVFKKKDGEDKTKEDAKDG